MITNNKTCLQDDDLNLNSKKQKLNNEKISDKKPETLSEKYGIASRINHEYKQFKGVIKMTSGDFIVNEIDAQGNVVHLTNFDIPAIEEENKVVTDEPNEEEAVITLFSSNNIPD